MRGREEVMRWLATNWKSFNSQWQQKLDRGDIPAGIDGWVARPSREPQGS